MYTFYNKSTFQYNIGPILGKGGFGTVYSVDHTISNKHYAMKVLPKGEHTLRGRRELNIWMRIADLPCTVQLEEAIDDNAYIMIIMERLHDTLADRLKTQPLTERECAQILYDLLHWLQKVHQRGIAYLDFKPENIGFRSFDTLQPTVIDFGCSRFIPFTEDGKPGILKYRSGTPMFYAPEVIIRQFNTCADLWSIGVLTYYMLTKEYPFMDSRLILPDTVEFERRVLTFQRSDLQKRNLSNNAYDFIANLLVYDQDLRATVPECLLHPFIQENV